MKYWWFFFLPWALTAQYPVDTVYAPVFTSTPPLPAWHETITDTSVPAPVDIFRMTRYNAAWQWYPAHAYAKIQPWNADGTRIKFYSALLYDAATGDLLGDLPGDLWDSRWSHTDPDLLYSFRPGGTVKKYFLSADSTVILLQLQGYEKVLLGPGEGNTSWDDGRVVLVGKHNTDLDIISIDLHAASVTAVMTLPGAWGAGDRPAYIDWASVSPSGDYALIMWNTALTSASQPYNGHYGVEVYTGDSLRFVRRISDYGNHGDFNFTPAGEEVFVQFYGQQGTVHAYFLDRDSVFTVHTHPDFGYGDAHLSGQNYLRPGWIYASTDPSKGGLVVAIKLDGSQTVEYFGHHFSSAANYDKSPMPVPSPDGTRVLFKSDFGHGQNAEEVYDFVARAADYQYVGPLDAEAVKIYPNPFDNSIDIILPGFPADIALRDVRGRFVFVRHATRSRMRINAGGLKAGVYFLEVRTTGGRKILLKR